MKSQYDRSNEDGLSLKYTCNADNYLPPNGQTIRLGGLVFIRAIAVIELTTCEAYSRYIKLRFFVEGDICYLCTTGHRFGSRSTQQAEATCTERTYTHGLLYFK